jgi:hypothetical protein
LSGAVAALAAVLELEDPLEPAPTAIPIASPTMKSGMATISPSMKAATNRIQKPA